MRFTKEVGAEPSLSENASKRASSGLTPAGDGIGDDGAPRQVFDKIHSYTRCHSELSAEDGALRVRKLISEEEGVQVLLSVKASFVCGPLQRMMSHDILFAFEAGKVGIAERRIGRHAHRHGDVLAEFVFLIVLVKPSHESARLKDDFLSSSRT